jgi:tetratricopeptide (TPR) repeat protein
VDLPGFSFGPPMKERHLSREILDLFALGDLPAAEAEEVELHLDVCADCRDRADESSTLLSLPLLDWLGSGYDRAFDRALLGAAEQFAGLRREVRGAEDLLAELLRDSAPERRRKIREEERFHSLKLCELLRSRSYDHRFSNPEIVRESAELAVGLAQNLDPHRYGFSLVENTRALSWCSLSNAFRIVADFWRAERALREAWSHYEQSYGDAFTNAELLTFTASLKISQRQFPKAYLLLDQAVEIYQEGQQLQLEGSALIQKGLVLGYDGSYENALKAIRSGLARIGTESSRLLLVAQHNLSRNLIHVAAIEEGRQLIDETRPLYCEIGDPLLLAHLHWIEAELAQALGREAEAEIAFHEARQILLACQNGQELFFVSLDLAMLYTKAGRRREVRELLSETIPLGEVTALPRQVLAARILYEQASRG